MKASMACVFFLLSMGIPFHKGYAEGKSCGIEAAYGAVNALGIGVDHKSGRGLIAALYSKCSRIA